MTFNLRWGICSTGSISHAFAKDLLIDPNTRGSQNILHEVAAVASRSPEQATIFVNSLWQDAKPVAAKEAVRTHDTYAELFADPDVDVIFIGSPPSVHYSHAHAALSAGKAVLLEKPFVCSAAQAKILVDLARAKKVFLMEGLWTRFQPCSFKVQEIVNSGILGELRSVQAEHGVDFHSETQPPSHRMVRRDLAGGALLDIAWVPKLQCSANSSKLMDILIRPYPWTWLTLLLCPPPSASTTALPVPALVASATHAPIGVDEHVTAVVKFPQPSGKVILGTLTASITQTPRRVLIAQGSKGILEVYHDGSCPPSFSYSAWDSDADYATQGKAPSKTETFDFSKRPGDISGLAWEADEVARCIQSGKKESERWPLRETIRQMEVFDEIRRQCNITFPDEVETLVVQK
ncbi:hypothetical protein P7C70_g5755, partial [Phenoliferia sp. Uapishka_3]